MTLGQFARGCGKTAGRFLQPLGRPARRIWSRPAEATIGVLALLVILLCLLASSPALCRWVSRYARSGNKYVAFAQNLVNPFRNRNVLLESDLPVYDLKIDRQDFARIEAGVKKARRQGWMSEDLEVWVPARFTHDGREYNVKVRVRGDLPPHWEGVKKSWRIRFLKSEVPTDEGTREEKLYFEGKRQINLVIPRDRDFVVAPLVNSVMRDQGLVVPRDGFAVLRINGRLQGLYYEVEQFDKPLLASNRRPETTIFGQNDRAMHFEQYTKYGTPVTADARFDLGSVKKQVDEDGQLAMRALQVLIEHSLNPTEENFRRARAVLDWEKYLRFRNITTLLNTNHVRFGSDNLKLYYDPSRGLLEPIPWDAHLTKMPKEPGTIDFWNSHGPDELQRATLNDPLLRLQRNRLMWELVAGGGKQLLERFETLHERIRPLAWADVLTTPVQGYKMDRRKEEFEYNVHRVHKVLSNSSANCTYRLHADDRASIEIASTNFSGIRVSALRLSIPSVLSGEYRLYHDTNDNGRRDDADTLLAEAVARDGFVRLPLDELVLPGVEYGGEEIDGRYWEFMKTLTGRKRFFLEGRLADPERGPLDWTPPELEVAAVNAVTEKPMKSYSVDRTNGMPPHSIGIAAYDATDVFDLDAPAATREEFLQAHPEFAAAAKPKNAVELGGQVHLRGTAIVPKSTPLVIRPGTEITMHARAAILAYGGLRALGTAAEPIRIHAAEGEGPWGTVAAIRPPAKVVLRHAEISGGGQAQINGILFSGGLAVHESDLEMIDCRVRDMASEDGLNLKNGHVRLERCVFARNASDSVDIDFGVGDVRNCWFLNNANDGLDISGSRLIVADCQFEGNGDKGFSVGERSKPTLVNGLFLNNRIGISSKDLSHARLAHATFVGNTLAVEAKRKKPFFGKGSIEIVGSVFADNETLYDEDYFSQGEVDIRHSLADRPLPSSTTHRGRPRFRSPETGDYRLAPDASGGSSLPRPSGPDWLRGYDRAAAARMPGVVTDFGGERSSIDGGQ